MRRHSLELLFRKFRYRSEPDIFVSDCHQVWAASPDAFGTYCCGEVQIMIPAADPHGFSGSHPQALIEDFRNKRRVVHEGLLICR